MVNYKSGCIVLNETLNKYKKEYKKPIYCGCIEMKGKKNCDAFHSGCISESPISHRNMVKRIAFTIHI
jgi:hypothetical protein